MRTHQRHILTFTSAPAKPSRGPMLPNLLTVEQTAEYLSVSPRTVQRLITERRLSSVRVGRAARVTEDALREFVCKPIEREGSSSSRGARPTTWVGRRGARRGPSAAARTMFK